MKLYVFPVAPNPTKVCLYLAEKAAAGAAVELHQVRVDLLAGEHKAPEHLARNPLGRLPVLELENGICITESLAIIEYLEETHPEPPMIGSMPLERARVRELERIADLGVLLPIGHLVQATNSPQGTPPQPEVAAYFRQALERNLALIEERLNDGRTYLAGEQPTIADFTLAAALQFARYGEVEIGAQFDNVSNWDKTYRSRPAAQSALSL
ncbi:MAG TPA: glutathione S-transferase family protein [Terriglobales bacterium]|nr:glutathione S-transferase family protein [Terriglobales bacterium]